MTGRVAIVGGGLAGLYAAWLLERQGLHDYVLLEARSAFGGRIRSARLAEGAERFDLGPTWFWPALQPQLDRLVRDLRLARFEQHETGDMVVERSPAERPLRMRGYASSPSSMRLASGMEALVDALRGGIDASRLVTGSPVRRIRCGEGGLELECEDARGRAHAWSAWRVLLAVPPRLAAARIAFAPALPETLLREWRATATWMAPHAKYVAVYEKPFWREQGLSGEARSVRGPLAEVHDASAHGGGAALVGFLGVPAHVRSQHPSELLMTHCRAQLARLFGPDAAAPRAEFLQDWAADPDTATADDQDGMAQHGAPPASTADAGAWRDRLVGIASEWSPQFPGYVAGAIEAAGLGVRRIMEMRR